MEYADKSIIEYSYWKERIFKTINFKTEKSYIFDALYYGYLSLNLIAELIRLRKENKFLFDNLTATQVRCSELKLENQSLKS